MRLVFTIIGIIMVFLARAQQYPVAITIAVLPPYYPKISDYVDQPGKIMATMVNTSAQILNVYVQGSVTGTGNIRIYTDPGWKMPHPVVLQPGIPFQFTRQNLEEIFNESHLVFEGITKDEVVYGNGLPEDDYVICLRAFDYRSDEPVSMESPQGCSNIITITSLEPPVILRPACGSEEDISAPQNLVFTWTRPPGAPVNTLFDIKIIEVLPFDRNIDDAIATATHPVFLEKTVQSTFIVLGPSDPQLVPGKKYAFVVTAYDPLKKVYFRNNGTSEVCSFEYGSNALYQSLQIDLLTPENGTPLNDSLPVFTWKISDQSPVALFRLAIYEVLPGQNKEDAIKNTPYFTRDGITDMTFTYPSTAKPLNKNSGYCWTIAARLNNQVTVSSQVYSFGLFSCPDLCTSTDKPKNRKVEIAFTPHGKTPGEMTQIFEWVDEILNAAGKKISVPGGLVSEAFKKAVEAIMTRGFDVWVRVCCDNCEYEVCWVYWNRLNWVHHCSPWKICVSNETLARDGEGWKPVGTGTPPITSWAECDAEIKKTAAAINCP